MRGVFFGEVIMVEYRVTRLEAKVDGLEDKLDAVGQQLSDLNAAMNRYRGAWGMFVMIGSALATAVSMWFKWKE
jgi:hypothetical protein